MPNWDIINTDPKGFLTSEVTEIQLSMHEIAAALPTMPAFTCSLHITYFSPLIIALHPTTAEEYQATAAMLAAAGWTFDGNDYRVDDAEARALHRFTHPAWTFVFQMHISPAEVGEIKTTY